MNIRKVLGAQGAPTRANCKRAPTEEYKAKAAKTKELLAQLTLLREADTEFRGGVC